LKKEKEVIWLDGTLPSNKLLKEALKVVELARKEEVNS
jgi:hypothetical protein